MAVRDETGTTKFKAGNRIIGLPDELLALLQRHRTEQDDERAKAAELWQETDYVFTTPTGQPLNLRTDHREWKLLVARAGVAERRLHDARHTAATVLLLLGVAERTVMGVMGWSNTAMAARYQHLTATIRRDVAQRVGGLWQPAGQTAPGRQNGDATAGTPSEPRPVSNATEMQPPPQTLARRDQHARHFPRSEVAEAEGFEPPVPLGTLAFKLVDLQFRTNHTRRLSRSIVPAGRR